MIRAAICICFCSCFVLSSCRKEKLDGEFTELIVGNWIWHKSTKTIMNDNEDVIFSSDPDKSLIEIKSKGTLHVFENGDCLRKHRIKEVEANIVNTIPETINLFLTLNRKDSYQNIQFHLDINGESDTLATGADNDFLGLDLPSDDYFHYYIRK